MKLAVAALSLLLVGAAAPRTLKICADPNNLPFSNQAQQGFENKLVDIIAKDLGATVTYTWWAQRRGNLRETLKAGDCDIVPGIGSNVETAGTTRPYYRSTYVAVTRADRHLDIASFDDPRLKILKIGVQMIGADGGSNTPPAHSLMRRGIVDNVRGYTVYGDYDQPDVQAAIMKAVADGEVDVAFVWGPVAGYYADKEKVPLTLTPIAPHFDGPQLPMIFDISIGTRREDAALRDELEAVLDRHQAEIKVLLAHYHVPLVEEDEGGS
jgi:mxaJ protein